MQRCSLIVLTFAVAALAAPSAMAQPLPPIGGGYAPPNAIAIPLEPPSMTKAISGALFKPEGAGPFPAVIYMSGCKGLNMPEERELEKRVIEHNLKQRIVTLIVDPFTARQEDEGVCRPSDWKVANKFMRGSLDVSAARKVLAAMPEVDEKHIFLQGYSYGATVVEYATEGEFGPGRNYAGAIEYYPFCTGLPFFRIPTLVLIGGADDWTPADQCLQHPADNYDIHVYPGATHGFVFPFARPFDKDGHHFAYDKAATDDAEKRVDDFIKTHLK